jgi:hypothetical protein
MGVDRSVFLFDVDACGFVEIVHAGVFDDVQQAVTAWRALVGDTAQSARPERVETAERLLCLVHCDSGEEILRGSELRTVLDNWFRARRRIHDLADALRKRGTPLPTARSLYHDLHTDPMAKAFTEWHVKRHGTEPDPEVAGALAQEWMEGGRGSLNRRRRSCWALSCTAFCVSSAKGCGLAGGLRNSRRPRWFGSGRR